METEMNVGLTSGSVNAPAPQICVVDDDNDIRNLLAQYLGRAGFRVHTASDGAQLSELLTHESPDLILLDVMMPNEDGLSICKRLRAQSDVPIMMLTAMADPVDRVVGLELGADDYLQKPFMPRELLARVRAILKRRSPMTGTGLTQARCYRFAGWELDEAACTLRHNGQEPVRLTGGEFRLLQTFVRLPNRVFSRDDLSQIIHGRGIEPFERSVDVAVSRMRRRLGDSAKEPALIATVHAMGYVFRAKVEVIEQASC
jgi:two-component system, OmpR family, response regulator